MSDFKVSVELLSGRKTVKRAMLATMHITPLFDKEEFEKRMKYRLSDKTFFDLLIGKHSPIEEMKFWVDLYVPERVHTHLTRHKEIGKYVATSRKDISYGKDLVDGMRYMSLSLNPKRLIEISEQRLCYKSWHETNKVWQEVVNQCVELEPLLQYFLHRPCVKYGICMEGSKSCGDRTYEYMQNIFKDDIKYFLDKNTK
jgi:hypothetical protein